MESIYFEGKPCRACGATLRYVAKRSCVACSRARDVLRQKRMSPEERAKRRAACMEYHKANREKSIAKMREWNQANPERYSAYHKAYRAANYDRIYANVRARRAKQAGVGGRFTVTDVQRIGELQKWRCAWCKKPCADNYHADHIVPISKGGDNSPANICVACPSCNLTKKAKLPHEFAQTMGMLL